MQIGQLSHWLLRGLGGNISLLEQFVNEGLPLEDRDISDLIHLKSRLVALLRHVTTGGKTPLEAPPSWPWPNRPPWIV